MKRLMKLGVIHRLFLIVVLIINAYIYLGLYDYQHVELFRVVVFYLCIASVLIFVLPDEIRIMRGTVVIARSAKVDRMPLFIVVLLLVLLVVISPSKDMRFGISKDYFLAIFWVLVMFLGRSSCYRISSKFIYGIDQKIRIKDITEVVKTEDEIRLSSEKEQMIIKLDSILNSDRKAFVERVEALG